MNPRAPPTSSGALLSVLLVDPSPMSRACFAAAMSEYPEIQVHGVDRIDTADPDSRARLPDIVVLQLIGEDLSEQQLSSRLELCQEQYPTTPILILANDGPPDTYLAALAQNVSGYLTSDHGVNAVVSALQLVRAGLIVLPRLKFQQMISQSVRAVTSAATMSAPYNGRLTSRQQQVFELILDGLSNRKIADRLAISESTVKVHVRAIMQRSSVSSRTQLVSQYLGHRG
jgi:two-component system nitrate/nitrite response regulator NarL